MCPLKVLQSWCAPREAVRRVTKTEKARAWLSERLQHGPVDAATIAAWNKNADFHQLPPINITDKRFCGQHPDIGKSRKDEGRFSLMKLRSSK
jgi:hypothetical protein